MRDACSERPQLLRIAGQRGAFDRALDAAMAADTCKVARIPIALRYIRQIGDPSEVGMKLALGISLALLLLVGTSPAVAKGCDVEVEQSTVELGRPVVFLGTGYEPEVSVVLLSESGPTGHGHEIRTDEAGSFRYGLDGWDPAWDGETITFTVAYWPGDEVICSDDVSVTFFTAGPDTATRESEPATPFEPMLVLALVLSALAGAAFGLRLARPLS